MKIEVFQGWIFANYAPFTKPGHNCHFFVYATKQYTQRQLKSVKFLMNGGQGLIH